MRWHDSQQYIFLQNQEPDPVFFSPEFIGAFLGAFFAFLFGLASYRFIKRYERFVQHRNALVIFERLLNEHVDIIGLNKKVSLNTQRILEKQQLTHNRLIELPVKQELSIDLGSISLVNAYFMYERLLHRNNLDMQAMNYTLTRLEDVMIGGHVIAQENWHYITGAFAQIPGIMDSVQKSTIEILCVVRINIAKTAGKGIWYANTRKNWDIEYTEDEIKAQKEALEKEIEIVANQSIL
jgi:hypothetical protein